MSVYNIVYGLVHCLSVCMCEWMINRLVNGISVRGEKHMHVVQRRDGNDDW